MLARRASVKIFYQGVNISKDIRPYLTKFDYTDSEGRSDDIQITLQDKDGKWSDPWIPKKGDKIYASIETVNWYKNGEKETLNCGAFYVDDVKFKGPPDTVTIKALAVPISPGGKNTKRSRSWENATLSVVAGDIAQASELELLYDAPSYSYDRLDQSRETDLGFIRRQARKEGLATKVTQSKLVIYQESKYENKTPIKEYKKGDKFIISYDFEESAGEEQCKRVTLKYNDPKKKKVLTYNYDVPGVAKGPTITLNKRAKNIDEAKRWAQAAARDKNKNAKTGKLTLVGDVEAVQGITVAVKGFGKFDGKYFIGSSKHGVTSGYGTSVDLREVLGY